jgi:hypothetical protein
MGRGERIWRHASRVGWLGEQLGTLKDMRRFPFAFCYAGKKVGRVFVEGRRRKVRFADGGFGARCEGGRIMGVWVGVSRLRVRRAE